MKKTFILLFTFSFLLNACGKPISTNDINTDIAIKTKQTIPIPNTTPTEVTVNYIATDKAINTTTIKKSYTSTEVSEHLNDSSCWLILDGKVYDVTLFISQHPGGEAILKGCGKDATHMFSKHPESAKALKDQFYIGDLKV